MPSKGTESRRDFFVRVLQRLQPVRGLPVVVRYLITALIVLLFFGVRYASPSLEPYPFLLFLPPIVLTSFLFDRGSGFFATLFATALSIYFFIEPRGSFVLRDAGQVVAVAVFLGVGLFTAAIIEALRVTIEELVESEANLGDSLNLLEGVIEGTPDPIFVKDREGRFVRVNSVLAHIFGVPVDVIQGKRDRDFLPADVAEKIEGVDRQVMETRLPLVVEELVTVAGEGQRCFLSTKAPWYSSDGKVIGLIGIARDIHERKQAEGEVRAANAQKEVLLHDINHRVKNHLQSVMSLLAMSRRRVKDPIAQAELENSVARLGVLARVYDRLQVKGDGSTAAVNARDFLEGLCDEIGPALIGLRPVALRVRIEDVDLDAGRAVSLGLAVNELVQNALKYALPDDTAGSVSVQFGRREEGQLVLEIADDGVGLAPDYQPGTGTRLVRALAQQLGGTVAWDGPPGTRVELRMPEQAPI